MSVRNCNLCIQIDSIQWLMIEKKKLKMMGDKFTMKGWKNKT
jgi:hypothetical protein